MEYDVGIVGTHTNTNYGGGLTYFALKAVLAKLGKTTLSICPPGLDAPTIPAKITSFMRNPYRAGELYWGPNKLDLCRLNTRCEIFLVGSDQLYSTHFPGNGLFSYIREFSALDWVWDSKKKIAYAASFGQDTLVAPPEMKNRMCYFVRKFDCFSVRERSGIALCEANFGFTPAFVLDPVFLCDKEDYETLIDKSIQKSEIVCYILDDNPSLTNILQDASATLQMLVYRIEDAYNHTDKKLHIDEWLSLLSGASFIFTDSFHGMCLAILYNIPFIVFANHARGGTRFDLANELGLGDRVLYNTDEYYMRKDALFSSIDWFTVNKKLDVFQQNSRKWLLEALEPEKKYPSTYDILAGEVQRLRQDVNNLHSPRFLLKLFLRKLKNKLHRFI